MTGRSPGAVSTRRSKAPSAGTITDDPPVADATDGGAGDWLAATWREFPERQVDIVRSRLGREKLAAIGARYGITRERVRQIEAEAGRTLVNAQRRCDPDLPERLGRVLASEIAVPDARMAGLVPTDADLAREVLLRLLGVGHPVTWDGVLRGWWCHPPDRVHLLLKQLIASAPVSRSEMERTATSLGFPAGLPLHDLLTSPASPVTLNNDVWLRRNHLTRDVAYLWLRAQGHPRTLSEIARGSGATETAAREVMHRDDRFVYSRPDAQWALTEWQLPDFGRRYRNAVEVMVEVLRDLGPLTLDELVQASQRRYPVTAGRIKQCLCSHPIGVSIDGRYDLVERGARPVDDREPAQPASIHSVGDGSVVDVSMTVTNNALRGSGVVVPRWLTWHLGLRTAPVQRRFPFSDFDGSLVVRRVTKGCLLSTLRPRLRQLGLAEGCKITLRLCLEPDSATISHACPANACPAKPLQRFARASEVAAAGRQAS